MRLSPESANRAVSARNKPARTPVPVLVLAQPSPETDELLNGLVKRPDLSLIRVASADAASLALRDIPIALTIACPETPADVVTQVIALVGRSRRGTPFLAVRARQSVEPNSWRTGGIGILRCPLLPDVLSRTVDVALGIAAPAQGGPRR